MKNILTTIPKAKYSSWPECEATLVASDGSETGGFWLVNTPNLPTQSGVGAQCYMVYSGQIRGYFHIVDTGKTEDWRDRHRIGKRRNTMSLILANWFPIKPILHTGFQGWRYTVLRP